MTPSCPDPEGHNYPRPTLTQMNATCLRCGALIRLSWFVKVSAVLQRRSWNRYDRETGLS